MRSEGHCQPESKPRKAAKDLLQLPPLSSQSASVLFRSFPGQLVREQWLAVRSTAWAIGSPVGGQSSEFEEASGCHDGQN